MAAVLRAGKFFGAEEHMSEYQIQDAVTAWRKAQVLES